ncbi:unknown [Clostridium sp. CAG:149]|nr:unknown [Clostridium sp. CAG:149]
MENRPLLCMTLMARPQNTRGIMVSTALKKFLFVENGPSRNLFRAVSGSSATANMMSAAITRAIRIEVSTRMTPYQSNFFFLFISYASCNFSAESSFKPSM